MNGIFDYELKNYEQHMNTKMQTTDVRRLSPNLAKGNHILVPHDGHADDP